MLLVQSRTVVTAAFFFFFSLNEGINLWFEIGASGLSVRPLWFSALLNGCSSLRINVRALQRTCIPGLYSLSIFCQTWEWRGLRLSWKACKWETATQHAASRLPARMSHFWTRPDLGELMRKCNMGTLQDVREAVLFSTPVLFVCFLWCLFLLFFVWLLLFLCVNICI